MAVERTDYDDGGWCERDFVDGKLHGRWTVYYDTGKKNWEREYQRDRQEGYERNWDESGILREEKHYRSGVLHGLWRKWDDNGTEEIIGDFQLGWEKGFFEKWPPRPHSNYGRLLPYLTWEPDQFRDHLPAVQRELKLPTRRLERDKSRRFRDEFGASYFSYVNLIADGEQWPSFEGTPLVPLLQLDCRGLSALLHYLAGVTFLTMFARRDPQQRSDLVIRTYGEGDSLRQVEPPYDSIAEEPHFMQIGPVESSFPDQNDLPAGLRATLEDGLPDSPMLLEAENRFSCRLGGWPAWLQQSGVYTYGEFVLQLDRLKVQTLRGGSSAVHYFFRDESEWTWASESLSPLYDPSGPR